MGSGDGAFCETETMTSGTLVGYARVSADAQDLTAQRDALTGLGVLGHQVGDTRAAGVVPWPVWMRPVL